MSEINNEQSSLMSQWLSRVKAKKDSEVTRLATRSAEEIVHIANSVSNRIFQDLDGGELGIIDELPETVGSLEAIKSVLVEKYPGRTGGSDENDALLKVLLIGSLCQILSVNDRIGEVNLHQVLESESDRAVRIIREQPLLFGPNTTGTYNKLAVAAAGALGPALPVDIHIFEEKS